MRTSNVKISRRPSNIPATETQEFSNEALEKELLATPAAELAKIAIDRGNAQRGKKLFYESAGA